MAMRIPAEGNAGRRGNAPGSWGAPADRGASGQHSAPPRRDAAPQPGSSGQRGRRGASGRHSAGGPSVFAPGYDAAPAGRSRGAADSGSLDRGGRSGPGPATGPLGRGLSDTGPVDGSWPGSGGRRRAGPEADFSDSTGSYWYGAPGGAAEKGPVRGYPPSPGQPPPTYPPGQFAAWNRDRRGRGRPAALPSPDASRQDASRQDAARPDRPYRPDASRPDNGRPDNGRQDNGRQDPELSYPLLAVSDPAADVTTTQTWRAVAEGRTTGTWTAPPGLRSPAEPRALTAGGTPGQTSPASGGRPVGGLVPPGSRLAATGRAARPPAGPEPTSDVFPRIRDDDTGPSSGPHTAPGSRSGGSRRSSGSRQSGRARGDKKRPMSVHLAVVGALLLVVGAAGVLGFTVLHKGHPQRAGQAAAGAASGPSASASASLGPYGMIASRRSDPQALTLAQLYPASFTLSGATVSLAATSLGTDCSAAITGAKLQSAAAAAGCTQVARATYLSTSQGIMATIGVLNLSTGDTAKKAAQSADASDFISQLTAKSGQAKDIGEGTGIEQAAAKGHYLILIWAELTNLKKPNSQQSAQIESFMTQLLQNTANVSLSTRMLTGKP